MTAATRLSWVLAMTAFAARRTRIVYVKSFPGSGRLSGDCGERSGAVTYKAAADDAQSEDVHVDAAADDTIFDLAQKLDQLRIDESGSEESAKWARKTFRWEENGKKNEVEFNYSLDEECESARNDWFERSPASGCLADSGAQCGTTSWAV